MGPLALRASLVAALVLALIASTTGAERAGPGLTFTAGADAGTTPYATWDDAAPTGRARLHLQAVAGATLRVDDAMRLRYDGDAAATLLLGAASTTPLQGETFTLLLKREDGSTSRWLAGSTEHAILENVRPEETIIIGVELEAGPGAAGPTASSITIQASITSEVPG